MSHTVLLVEDEEDLRETMREILELHGYEVVA
jgi:DNA-binding response OmpR family regulator